jgi:hypothetical protein
MAASAQTTSWLAQHPEILLGRSALKTARDRVPDAGNTFDLIEKPLPDLILHQQFDADTMERLWVVALVNDEEAESSYSKRKRVAEHENCEDCRALRERGPDDYLYERAPGRRGKH